MGGGKGGCSELIVTPCFPLGYNSLSAFLSESFWDKHLISMIQSFFFFLICLYTIKFP